MAAQKIGKQTTGLIIGYPAKTFFSGVTRTQLEKEEKEKMEEEEEEEEEKEIEEILVVGEVG